MDLHSAQKNGLHAKITGPECLPEIETTWTSKVPNKSMVLLPEIKGLRLLVVRKTITHRTARDPPKRERGLKTLEVQARPQPWTEALDQARWDDSKGLPMGPRYGLLSSLTGFEPWAPVLKGR